MVSAGIYVAASLLQPLLDYVLAATEGCLSKMAMVGEGNQCEVTRKQRLSHRPPDWSAATAGGSTPGEQG